MPAFATQQAHDVRFEWGWHGAAGLARGSGVVVIVDVLSYSTCLDIACAQGATVYPFRFRDDSVQAFAQDRAATVAVRRGEEGYSLSPHSLQAIPAGTRLVLPSPNGATLTLEANAPVVLAGCLRNAQAVARLARTLPGPVTVVAAGERWPDNTLRPSLEDLLGAGALLHHMAGDKSVEAQAAAAFFAASRTNLKRLMTGCASGIELAERGFANDVALASAYNVSACVPRFDGQAYCAGP
ncbi:MAG: 2-phosphosulfolactate phosphatase [Pseudomonadales bacterium]|nr:2-phosphosulfolactate phosphatase [Pseudomonadales bacterium]MCP5183633.1 2-phosphosulfolactate phosphatase [Pseudomonadales bacterium]